MTSVTSARASLAPVKAEVIGEVPRECFPSYNLGVMTKPLLKPTSSLDALLERLSPEPHLRGKEFEHAAKWFLETDPAYASELREVWLWDDWPGRWGPDIGIDLVAETHEDQRRPSGG